MLFQTLDLLAALLDKSLLYQMQPDAPEPRFAMLETIRGFGLEQLAESGELAAVAARHAAWCVNLAEDVRRSGRLSQGHGLGMLEAEHPNMRAALGWLLERGQTTEALHLAGELAEFWLRHGHLAEWQGWLERALAADGSQPTAARARALVGLSMLLWPRNDLVRAEQLLSEAEAVARAAGDAGAVAYARLHQGYVAAFRGNFDLAVTRGEEALETSQAIPQGFILHGPLYLVAWTALARGENDRALEHYQRLLASALASGDEISIANSHFGLAVLAERRGEPERALAGFVEAAAVCQGYGDHSQATAYLDLAAVTAATLGQLEPAVRLFAAAETLRAAGGLLVLESIVDRPRYEQALAAAQEALGAERFAAAWTAGAALSLDEAIAGVTAPARPVSPPVHGDPGAGAAGLTAREIDVLRFLVLGWSDKQMAAQLGIGRRTVSSHVATIRDKLDAPSRTAAATIAMRDGLI